MCEWIFFFFVNVMGIKCLPMRQTWVMIGQWSTERISLLKWTWQVPFCTCSLLTSQAIYYLVFISVKGLK